SLTISDASVAEGNSGTTNAVLTVSLSAASSQTITVAFRSEERRVGTDSDYTAASGTLIFKPGQTSQTITIAVHGDTLNEADEVFFVNLSNEANATLGDAQATVTIRNDDALPSLTISDASVGEGNSGTTNAVLTVSLSAASSQTITVAF